MSRRKIDMFSVQKTTATLGEVGDATGKAFTAFGSSVSTKFSEMK